ncbi:MAG: hypothetical protein M1818_006784 [Claussenomyces sp. TS43310]|nr:MAG: hypothetical protein M1818_006784 [Claussenomyces sp. TS43310]
MSEGEIWDDSALVESWNEALEEYKRYHSLHARGEKVEAVLQSHDLDASTGSTADDTTAKAPQMKFMAGLPAGTGEAENDTADVPQSHLSKEKLSSVSQTANSRPSMGASNGGPSLPQHLIGSVHDDSLKNLLMSWYYAGYYTGLYEGQQQVREGAV